MMRRLGAVSVGCLVFLALLGAACSGSGGSGGGDSGNPATNGGGRPDGQGLSIKAVSTRADMVTDGDVLIGVDVDHVDSVRVDGKPTDVDFHTGGEGSYGLVKGLPEGKSTISVAAGDETAELAVVNHPVNGPVFSGERLPMAVCTTDRYTLAASSAPECFAKPVVSYAYVDAGGDVQTIDDPSAVPADAQKVTVDGAQRPAVLRVENGVIDRGVYTITTLAPADATKEDLADWDDSNWNGRLVYRFGGGCGTTFAQGFEMMGAPSIDLLADGYAFATNTLDTFQVQCQDILSAEAAMMTKEHFVEAYGVPEVTIGEGGSGGAIQQLLVAQNYPGILDAIAPALPFPDAVSIAPGVVDCALLRNFYASPEGSGFTAEKQSAVNGHLSAQTCAMWEQTFVPVIDPTKCGFGDAVSATGVDTALPGLSGGLPTVPVDQRYDPKSNPDGVRCTFQDSYPQIFPTDPKTGFRERPVDNVGLQYGLKALNAGSITPEEFVVLNERIGGFDIDANPIAKRMAADEETISRLYSTGRVVEGGPLLDIPVLAFNVYTDDEGDIHDRMRMFSLNERLKDAKGNQAPNYIMWTRPPAPNGSLLDKLSGSVGVGARATRLLDEWATAIAADDSGDPKAEVVARTRPDEAVNTCFDVDGKVVDSGPDVYNGPGPCTDAYPIHDDPRTAAGAPLRNDIGKCELQLVRDAIDGGVYKVKLSEAQVSRLGAVFPDGVCDWTRPGVGQVPLGDPWQTFD